MPAFDAEEYERWMHAAEKTLDSARGDMERGDHNWACFKAQQASELAVKALLYGIGEPAYGHSVSRLLEKIGHMLEGGMPDDIVECGKLLDKLYIPTRYPDAWSEGEPHYYYTRADSETAIRCARVIIEWVKGVWRELSRRGYGSGEGL